MSPNLQKWIPRPKIWNSTISNWTVISKTLIYGSKNNFQIPIKCVTKIPIKRKTILICTIFTSIKCIIKNKPLLMVCPSISHRCAMTAVIPQLIQLRILITLLLLIHLKARRRSQKILRSKALISIWFSYLNVIYLK